MSAYLRGTADPNFRTDEGSGRWGSQRATAEMRAMRIAIMGHLPHAVPLIGPDAAAHMRHYMENSGSRYTIRLAELIADTRSARELFDLELAEAKRFVETLPPGSHPITSARGSGGYAMMSESPNWSYAIGGYTVWGRGTAHVREAADGQLGYQLDFELRFYDRYDWHEGNAVRLFGIETCSKLVQK